MGHTTRCIPLIRHLLARGHRITVAGNELQQQIIAAACTGAALLPLEGYKVRYSRSGSTLIGALALQLPRLLRAIREEHRWLLDVAREHAVDGIISDNRYGLYHPELPSVILTHQLEIRTGLGKFPDTLLRAMHYRRLQRFGQCWVVDTAEAPGLAGRLSHPPLLPDATRYIGWLSQMSGLPGNDGGYLLIVLSGPEPQRTLLSRLLWPQALTCTVPVVFVEGAMPVHSPADVPGHIRYFGRLDAAALEPLMAGAGLVICRSGYSTLMDLVLLGKKAVLIPTPGQTEQLYLARTLHREGHFMAATQSGLDLDGVLKAAADFPFRQFAVKDAYRRFAPVLDAWTDSL